MDAVQVATKGAFPKQIGKFMELALIPFMLLKERKDYFLFDVHSDLFLFEFKINNFNCFTIIPTSFTTCQIGMVE